MAISDARCCISKKNDNRLIGQKQHQMERITIDIFLHTLRQIEESRSQIDGITQNRIFEADLGSSENSCDFWKIKMATTFLGQTPVIHPGNSTPF